MNNNHTGGHAHSAGHAAGLARGNRHAQGRTGLAVGHAQGTGGGVAVGCLAAQRER